MENAALQKALRRTGETIRRSPRIFVGRLRGQGGAAGPGAPPRLATFVGLRGRPQPLGGPSHVTGGFAVNTIRLPTHGAILLVGAATALQDHVLAEPVDELLLGPCGLLEQRREHRLDAALPSSNRARVRARASATSRFADDRFVFLATISPGSYGRRTDAFTIGHTAEASADGRQTRHPCEVPRRIATTACPPSPRRLPAAFRARRRSPSSLPGSGAPSA